MEPSPLVVVTTPPDQVDAAPGVRHVLVRGEVDMSTAPELATCLQAVVTDGVERVVLDTSDVTFLDSTGLRVLVELGTQLEQAGGRLLVEPMSAAVRRVLDMTGLLERYAPE